METKKKIEAVLKEVPNLTCNGVGVFDPLSKLSKKDYQSEFKTSQKTLLESAESFEKICEWLNKIKNINTINNSRTSYGLRYIAEKEIGSVLNGVFIAAAIHSGFKYEIDLNEINVSFSMSEKSIREIEKTGQARS